MSEQIHETGQITTKMVSTVMGAQRTQINMSFSATSQGFGRVTRYRITATTRLFTEGCLIGGVGEFVFIVSDGFIYWYHISGFDEKDSCIILEEI